MPAVGILVISFTDIRSLPYLPVALGRAGELPDVLLARLSSRYNLSALRNTFVFAIAVTIFQNVIALLIAVLLNQRLRGRNFARAVVFLPTILGVTVIGLIFSLIFNPSAGPAAAALGGVRHVVGLLRRPEPGDDAGDPGAGLERHRGGGGDLPRRAAGDSPRAVRGGRHRRGHLRQKLRNVTIPLLAPSVTANTLLCIIGVAAELPADLRADRSDQPGHPGAQPGHLHPGLRRRPGRHRPVPGLRRRDLDGPVRHRRGHLARHPGLPAQKGDRAVSTIPVAVPAGPSHAAGPGTPERRRRAPRRNQPLDGRLVPLMARRGRHLPVPVAVPASTPR